MEYGWCMDEAYIVYGESMKTYPSIKQMTSLVKWLRKAHTGHKCLVSNVEKSFICSLQLRLTVPVIDKIGKSFFHLSHMGRHRLQHLPAPQVVLLHFKTNRSARSRLGVDEIFVGLSPADRGKPENINMAANG